MGLSAFLAAQFRRPSGWFGKLVVARVLDRANGPMNELTLRALEPEPDDRVLEVGSGGGDLIARLAPLVANGKIAAADFSPEMIALCGRRFAPLVQAGKLELVCASVDALPYAPRSFTQVCTVNTIYFWPDPVGALSKLRECLVEGGRIAVTFNPRETAQKVPYTRHFLALYGADEVPSLLERAGFRDVRSVQGETRLGPFLCAFGTK